MGDENLITLSKSRLNAYIQCPEKYYLGYELNIRPLKANPSLVEGSALHHLVESGVLYGKHIDLDELLNLASERFWESTPFETTDYLDIELYNLAQKTCLTEAKAFLDQIGTLEATAMEQYGQVQLIDPLTQKIIPEIYLQGYIDLVDVVNDSQRLIDIKTTSRKPQPKMAELALELTLYAYLTTYPDFNDQSVAFLYLTRTKEPKISWDESNRTFVDYIELANLCKNIAINIIEGRYWKNPGMQCSYCDYYSLCYRQDTLALEKFGEKAVAHYFTEKEVFIPSKELLWNLQ